MRTLVLLSCVLAYVTAECMPGGYCPMQNPESNLMLQEIIQFALTTHAAKTNSMCDNTFTIRHAETQVKTVTWRHLSWSHIKPGLGRGRLTAVLFREGGCKQVKRSIMLLSWDLSIWLETLTIKHHRLVFQLKMLMHHLTILI